MNVFGSKCFLNGWTKRMLRPVWAIFRLSDSFPKFVITQVQVDIGFEQLVQLARKLPASQWTKLKAAIDSDASQSKEPSQLEAFLLTAPTFTKKQLNDIAKTRNTINQWRAK